MISIISALPGRVTTSVIRRWPAAALQSFEQASNGLWLASSHCSMRPAPSPSPQKHTLPSSHRLMRQVRDTVLAPRWPGLRRTLHRPGGCRRRIERSRSRPRTRLGGTKPAAISPHASLGCSASRALHPIGPSRRRARRGPARRRAAARRRIQWQLSRASSPASTRGSTRVEPTRTPLPTTRPMTMIARARGCILSPSVVASEQF